MYKLLAILLGFGGGILFRYLKFIHEDVTATIRRTAAAISNLTHESIPNYYISRENVVQNLQR